MDLRCQCGWRTRSEPVIERNDLGALLPAIVLGWSGSDCQRIRSAAEEAAENVSFPAQRSPSGWKLHDFVAFTARVTRALPKTGANRTFSASCEAKGENRGLRRR